MTSASKDAETVCLGVLAEEIAAIETDSQEDLKLYLALLYHMQDRMTSSLKSI